MGSILGLAFTAQASFISDNMKKVAEGSENGVQVSVYETQDQPFYYLPTSVNNPALEDMQAEISSRTSVDPYYLLRRQRDIFFKVGFLEVLPRFEFVLKQKIYEISFLEKSLFELYAEKLQIKLFKSYSEFGANILHGPRGELVIIFISNSKDATVPDTALRRNVLKAYLEKGFHFKIHIHNHPFAFNGESDGGDIAGTPIPSGGSSYGDVGAYRSESEMYRLENAWITNGFSTLRMEASDFSKY